MKKYLMGIFAVIIALSLSAFAIIKDDAVNKTQQQYYWFGLTGSYLGRSASAPPECNGGTIDCAYGYINVADPDDPEQPAGNPNTTATKH